MSTEIDQDDTETITIISCQTGKISDPGQLFLLWVPVLWSGADTATGHEEVSAMVTGRIIIAFSPNINLTTSIICCLSVMNTLKAMLNQLKSH